MNNSIIEIIKSSVENGKEIDEDATILILKSCVENGHDIDEPNERDQIGLHSAVSLEMYKIAKFLIDNKANVNVFDSCGVSPLIIAIQKKNKEMVKLLLENGASPDIPNKLGLTPINFAGLIYPEIIGLLEQYIHHEVN